MHLHLTGERMEPRPTDKMPPNHLEPIVRAVVFNALADYRALREVRAVDGTSTECADFIAHRLCETLEQDHWDASDRVRRALTKHTWGVPTDG
jgi:hypothetical protein